MKFERFLRPFWIGLTLFGALAVSASFAVNGVRRELAQWRVAAGDRRELEELVREVNLRRARLAEAVDGPAADPTALLRRAVPESDWTVEPGAGTDLPEGYRLRTATVRFQGAAWGEIRAATRAVRESTPPWRVTAVEIESTVNGLDGRLRLEALDKPGAED